MPPYVVYNRDFNRGLTSFESTGRTISTSSNELRLPYLHPSPSTFDLPQNTYPRYQPRSSISNQPNNPITTGDFSSSHTEDIESREAASILMTLHHSDSTQSQPNIDLLSIGGRSGLRSRGVSIRRHGVEPTDERLSTEIPESVSAAMPVSVGVGRERSESVSSLTSLEDLESIKEEDDNEGRADTMGMCRGGGGGNDEKGKAEGKGKSKAKKAKEKKSKKKTLSGTPRDYQRYAVRDDKGKFVRK